jgi:hypothetical protein
MTSAQRVPREIRELVEERGKTLRPTLHSVLEELFRFGAIDFKQNELKGITLYRGPREHGRRFCNIFPRTSFQFFHKDNELRRVPAGVDHGPEVY